MWTNKSLAVKGPKSRVLGIAAAIAIWLSSAGTSQAQIILSDTYTRADNTNLGLTEVGGFAYQEFAHPGGGVSFTDVAKIEGGRLRITGPFFPSDPTDPGSVRLLPGVGFDLDLSVEATILGDNYNPNNVANSPGIFFRAIQAVPNGGTTGVVSLILYPTGVYTLRAQTPGGFVPLANQELIDPAVFLATDADGDGILESNEPFTLRAQVIGDTFRWSMNGVEIGCFLLPEDAITGVNPATANIMAIGRTRIRFPGPELEIAYDNLVASVPDPRAAGCANDVPTANNQEVTTAEDTAVVITLTGSDIEGSALEFQITSAPSHGTLGEVTVTGPTTATVTYTPALNFNGTDSFLFTVDDGTDVSPAATIMITVSSVNDGPTANNQTITTDEDVAVPITLTGSDPENNPLTFTVETPPAKGTLDGTAPDVTYIPNPNFWGTDSFTFTVSDGSIVSAPATITITVNPVNDFPTATGFSETTPEDTPVTLTLLGSDPEGDPLTFSIVGEPSNGTLGPVTGSSVTYTPNPNFSGVDSFTFSASDGSSTSTPATVMITVTPALDPRAAIAGLIAQVEGLSLNRGQKQSLRKKLEAADRSLVRGRRNAAIHELEAFIREVRALQRSRRLDPPTASSLIMQAQRIIEMLTEETVAIEARDAARAEINRAIAQVGASDRRVIRAQRRFDRGLAAMDRGDFRRAAREFGLALRIARQI